MELAPKAMATIALASALIGGYVEHSIQKQSKSTEVITRDNNIVTVIKEKKNPDGTTETDTTITDHTKESDKSTIITATPPPNWFINFGTGLTRDIAPVYTLSLSRRVLGPIHIGVWGSTQQSVGVSLGLSF